MIEPHNKSCYTEISNISLQKGLSPMKLNPSVNVPAFLQTVQACNGEVCFVTKEGDILNLKSSLSQFVFASVIAGKLQDLEGHITVQNPQDAIRLKDYCV